MKAEDGAVIACRALAAYTLIAVMQEWVRYSWAFYDPTFWAAATALQLLWMVSPVLLMLVGSAALWFFAPRIVVWMLLPAITEPQEPLSIGAMRLQRVLFVAMGVFVILQMLPSLLSSLLALGMGFRLSIFIRYFVQLVIGLFLIFAAKITVHGLRSAVRWLRVVGRRHKPAPEEEPAP